MYRVLIADDEMPALRYTRNIIQQFCSQFQIVDAVISGEAALKVLQAQAIDLLITDISMHGMSGIELAQSAKKLQPDLHIVIISGYGEFEYAQGAIQAGVDEYVLKPVSITKMTSILQSIQEKLDSEYLEQAASLLPAIACHQPYDEAAATRLFARRDWYFAYVLLGNLNMRLPKKLGVTRLLTPPQDHFLILSGRDEEERILISKDDHVHIHFYLFPQIFYHQASPPTRITWLFACKFFRITDLLGAGPFPFGDMGLLCFGSDRAACGSCRKRKRTGNQAFPVHRGAPGTAGLRAEKNPIFLRFGRDICVLER